MDKNNNAVVVFSGGQDSTTLFIKILVPLFYEGVTQEPVDK